MRGGNYGREQDAPTAHPSRAGGMPTIVIARGEYLILTLLSTVNTPPKQSLKGDRLNNQKLTI
ncbi:MAG: hypothetical protein QNJ74_04430 [Trichodesmium sp. MO_231.B1]|nr:hypothetical protein [Trichodesmium sp. MO_231.B1]